jgi:acyl dehydratase
MNAVRLEYGRRPSALPYMLRGALPVKRRVTLSPQISAGWRDHRVDAGQLAAFARVAGLPAGPVLPLLYPHTFGFRLAMAILTHPSFPVPIWGVLQTRNRLVQYRPIGIGEALDFETSVAEGRAVPKGAEFDLRTTVHAAGDLAWESLVTFFARGRFGEPGPGAASPRAPTETGPLLAEWTMPDARHWQFGRFTGDYNGIHVWDWYARRFGFRHALYHPPRVLGECLGRLEPPARSDGSQRLDVWLKGPVSHGAKVRLHAAAGAEATTFGLFAGDERPCIVGRLQWEVAPPFPAAARRGEKSAASFAVNVPCGGG